MLGREGSEISAGGGRGGNRVAVGEIDVGKVDGAVCRCRQVSSVRSGVDGAVMVGASLLPWIVMVTV